MLAWDLHSAEDRSGVEILQAVTYVLFGDQSLDTCRIPFLTWQPD